MMIKSHSKCAMSSSRESRFMNEQEARILSSSLGLKTPLNKILLLCDLLF